MLFGIFHEIKDNIILLGPVFKMLHDIISYSYPPNLWAELEQWDIKCQHKLESPEESLVEVIDEVGGEDNDAREPLNVVEKNTNINVGIAVRWSSVCVHIVLINFIATVVNQIQCMHEENRILITYYTNMSWAIDDDLHQKMCIFQNCHVLY